MSLQKTINLFTLTLVSILFTACAIDGQYVDGKRIYEKEPITQDLINEVNQIALSIKENNLSLINARYIHPINGYYDVTKFENKNIFEVKKVITEADSNIDSFEIRFDKVTYKNSIFIPAIKTIIIWTTIKSNFIKSYFKRIYIAISFCDNFFYFKNIFIFKFCNIIVTIYRMNISSIYQR
jgi:hypothetical protein